MKPWEAGYICPVEPVAVGVALRECAAEIVRLNQTKQRAKEIEGMADCMDMVRQGFIEAGLIGPDVAPMFVVEAVLDGIAPLRRKAAMWDAHRDNPFCQEAIYALAAEESGPGYLTPGERKAAQSVLNSVHRETLDAMSAKKNHDEDELRK